MAAGAPGPELNLRLGTLLALLLLAVLVFPVKADARQEQIWAIAGKLACPVCAGQSVKDSNAQLAVQMRQVIAEQLDLGRSEREIIAYMVDRYGEEILLDPPKSGPQLWVWIGPVVVIASGLVLAASRFSWKLPARRRTK